MVTEIAPRHQREVFSPHPDDPYLTVEIGLYYLISWLRKQVGDFEKANKLPFINNRLMELGKLLAIRGGRM